MPKAPEHLPDPLGSRPFSTEEARRARVSRARLRAKDLTSSFHGGRARTAPATPLDLVEQYLPLLTTGAFFSHTSAALLHGMWLPLALEREMTVHVAVVLPRRAPRGRSVRCHALADRPALAWLGGRIPASSPWETWAQLARFLSVEDLVVAGESLLAKGRENPALMLERLAAVASDPDRLFHRRLSGAADLLRIGSRSAQETRFRRFVVRGGLPEPRVNSLIRDDEGRVLAEGDLAYQEYRVLIEYEGDGHREKQQFRKDIHRIERIQDEAWRVIRVTTDDEVERPDETLERIRRALRRSGWRG